MLQKIVIFKFFILLCIYQFCKSKQINYIKNGLFLINSCKPSQYYCLTTPDNLTIQNWIADPEMQISHAYFFDPSLGNRRAIDLCPQLNSCIKQIVYNLKKGSYRLQFIWATTTPYYLQVSNFNVQLNGKVLKNIFPKASNTKWTKTKIQFFLNSDQYQNQIKFCSMNPNISFKSCSFLSSVSLFKNNWEKNEQFIILSQNDKVTTKNIIINSTGTYSLKFVSKTLFNNEKLFNISVFWNDNEITKIYLNEQKVKLHHFQVSAITGINNLTFNLNNYSKQINYNILISHLKLKLIKCNYIKNTQNLIINGYFSILNCGDQDGYFQEVFNYTNYYCTPGWVAIDQIQIYRGNIFNSQIPFTLHIVQLNVFRNICLQQTIFLQSGKYILEFSWATRINNGPNINSFSLFIYKNDIVQQIKYTDIANVYRHEKIYIDISPEQWKLKIQFCGKGNGNGRGSAITNIRLNKLFCP